MRRLVLALCCASLPTLADGQQPPPQSRAALGRLVVLAVKCGVRPDIWGQRLDVALADLLRDSEGDSGLRDLTEAELNALHQWQADPTAACATLHDDPALQTADQLTAQQ
jgi:hypothetical protein